MSRSTPGRTHCKLLDDIATPANGGPSGRSGTPPSATPLGSPTALGSSPVRNSFSANPFACSVTELERQSSAMLRNLSYEDAKAHRRGGSLNRQTRQQSRRASADCGKSMSSAPVETLGLASFRSSRRGSARGGGGAAAAAPPAKRRWWRKLAARFAPDGSKVPGDTMLFMFLLGILSAATGFAMDLAIEQLALLRKLADQSLRDAMHAQPADAAGVWMAARASVWVGYSLTLVWLAIGLTGWLSPAAAGSGIPEIKSILAGSSSPPQKVCP